VTAAATSSVAYRVGVDVGGTFTDVLVETLAGEVVAAYKVPSTPGDPARAVLQGLGTLPPVVASAGFAVRHGTTVATNALIERKGAATALITNRGFRDVLALRRQARPALFSLEQRISPPLVPEPMRFEVAGRIGPDGAELEPLDPAEIEALARRLPALGVRTVAISLLHAYANPAQESAIAATLAQMAPDLFVTSSSEVAPEIGEFERTSTAVVNAYVGPAVRGYVARLDQGVRAAGGSVLAIIKSNGGATSPANACRFPVHLIESGPAAGVVAAAALGRRLGLDRLIAFDLGGTTAKVSVVRAGQPTMTREFQADRFVEGRDVGGYPIRSATVDLIEIGAGGGSLAWLDKQGLIKIGPESAGADPGPACYERGGERPTLTDAHAVIGNLSARALAAAGVRFEPERARAAIERHVAGPLGWTVARAAHAIVEIANAKMADLVRLATVRRGLDPRDYVLVAYGGGGPLHAAEIARALGIPEVIVPPAPGMFSAGGTLRSEIRHDLAVTHLARLRGENPRVIEHTFTEAESRVRGLFAAEAEPHGAVLVEHSIEARFAGQLFALEIPVTLPLDLDRAERDFREAYRREFGYDLPDSPVQLVNVKVIAYAEAMALNSTADAPPPGVGADPAHEALTPTGARIHQPVLTRADLADGPRNGPLTVADQGATVLVPQGALASLGAAGVLHVRVSGG
jgi:N-methylhydantoinase A